MENRFLKQDMSKTRKIFDIRYFIVIMLISGTIFYSQLMSHGKPVPILKSLEDFPKHIGSWSGETYRFSQAVYDNLSIDDSI
jgi:hypothetical protein